MVLTYIMNEYLVKSFISCVGYYFLVTKFLEEKIG
jgi:hypothetical protein